MAVGLAATVAALVAGCSTQRQTADCVDAQGHVMPDSYCQNTGSGYYSSGYHTYNHYHWIYGGHIGSYAGGYRTVSGGSTSPAEGADVVSRSGMSISHGGFGHSGFSHGAGGHGGFGG